MIATPVQNGAAGRSRTAELPGTQTPPSERDFELFFALTAECLSTRTAAERFGISQTRVLQVRERVNEWLGTKPPPLVADTPRKRVIYAAHLARQRIEYLLTQAMEAWRGSQGTTTKVRSSDRFDEITTVTTSHGDIRYLYASIRLNEGALKLAEGLEAALARVDGLSAPHAAPGTPQRAFPAADSPEGDCSREERAEAGARLAPETQADANDDEPEAYDEFAERRREFLAALDDNTAPVQPPRTDANGMLVEESEEQEEAEDLSLLPMAAGAEGLAETPLLTRRASTNPSLTHRVSVSRPLSRKERRARQRMLQKLRRKAK